MQWYIEAWHSNVYTEDYFSSDINECDNSTVMCGFNASCTNTAGSFECTCDDGYSGDELTCNG